MNASTQWPVWSTYRLSHRMNSWSSSGFVVIVVDFPNTDRDDLCVGHRLNAFRVKMAQHVKICHGHLLHRCPDGLLSDLPHTSSFRRWDSFVQSSVQPLKKCDP